MNAHPFSVGAEYKRTQLLDFVGSRQAQSGVIWGPLEPGCLICTSGGRHGRKVGYFDEPQGDGSWLYLGQGGAGDQQLTNIANARLLRGDRTVLLFTSREPTSKEVALNGGYGKLFTFRGAYNVVETTFVTPATGPRAGDRLIRFTLVPTSAPAAEEAHLPGGENSSQHLLELREALNAVAAAGPAGRIGVVEYRRRSKAVHRYALLRAEGICELCAAPAPFECERGIPFLEVHHLHRLADDGPDTPENVAAICPNCHRAVHYAGHRIQLQSTLIQSVRAKELSLGASSPTAEMF